MRTYVTIHQGTQPREAIPVLATEDPEVVGAALDAVARRLGVRLETEGDTPSLGLVHAEPHVPSAPDGNNGGDQ